MENKTKSALYKIVSALITALIIFLFTFFAYIASEYYVQRFDGNLTDTAVNIIKTIVYVLIYVSVLDFFIYNNKYNKSAWKDNGKPAYLSFIMWDMWLEAALMFLLLHKNGLAASVFGLTANKTLSYIIVAVFIILIEYLIRIRNVNKWRAILSEDKRSTVKKIITFLIVLSLISWLAPFVLIFLSAQMNVFKFIFDIVWKIVLGFLIVIFAIKYIKAFRARKSFLNELKRLCKEKDITISNNHSLLFSVIYDDGKINLKLKMKDKTIAVKLISCLNKKDHLYIFSEGGVIKELPVKIGSIRLFSLKRMIRFDSNECYVIITQPPYEVHNGDTLSKMPLDNGETVGKITLYFAKGFINTLDRQK
ncbi:MAG: hypothetical protein II135_05265 [Clostridia bacterium]|nr:hypothetical protein [Clostridia bacterium]